MGPPSRALAAARRVLAVGVALLVASACGPEAAAPPAPEPAASAAAEAPARPPYTGPERPNVVVYLIDTLRADRLGAYGYDRPTSPNIDAFAAGGTVFEQAIAPDTCTLGSVPSLLTSQYTLTHGVDDYGKQVSPQTPMLQTVLAEAGYATGSFITNVNAGPFAGLDRGFDTLHDAIRTWQDREALRGPPLEAIEAWLDGVGERPFFLYVHTAEPHRPYIPPSPWREKLAVPYDGKITGYWHGWYGFQHARSAADVAHVNALYDGEVALADAGFASFLEILEQKGLADDTLVVLTSDHGEELYDHGSWHHGHGVHVELVRIPLIVSGPGVEAGARVDVPVSLIDVAPAVLERVGLEPPASFEGRSLWGADPERALYTRSSIPPRTAAVRRAGWTLIQDAKGRHALYRHASDPEEREDRAAEHPAQVAELSALLETWLAGKGDDRPMRPLTDEETARLRALGYVE